MNEGRSGGYIASGELVEKELDVMIERRVRKGEEDPDEKEEIWKESVRRYNAHRREEMRVARGAHTTGTRPNATAAPYKT